jgi:hypothetical protein
MRHHEGGTNGKEKGEFAGYACMGLSSLTFIFVFIGVPHEQTLTKMNENLSTDFRRLTQIVFISYPCSFLSVFPSSVAIFVGVPHGPAAHQNE